MISTEKHPERDTVLFDGECRFCQRQIAILRNLDLRNRFIFKSLHDPSVAADFPELTIEQLQEQMSQQLCPSKVFHNLSQEPCERLFQPL